MTLAELCNDSPVDQFGAYLVERGAIDGAALQRATRLCHETGEGLGLILNKLGLVAESDMAEFLGNYLDLRVLHAKDYPSGPLLTANLSAKFIRQFRIIPLAESSDKVEIIVADPFDSYMLDAVRLALGKPAVPVIGLPGEIESAYERLYRSGTTVVEEIYADQSVGQTEEADGDIERLRDMATEAPVIRLVNQLIHDAVEMRASDVHIEPFGNKVRTRYRIDGLLSDVKGPPNRLRSAIASRIKLMAKLNIAETRLPQDGRIRLVFRGRHIDLRVSTVPTMYGESVVLRILNKESLDLDFAALGYEGQALERYLKVLDEPMGILLVTGPTGSGKTTTLYASLLRLNTTERKILTVEDPVEYELEGVNQLQVKPAIGLDFANALRSLVRQDPDVIMIGEIRDYETAEIAGQAALTGHKVLSTLHTNDAATSITRLLDMGVKDFLVTSTLNGIVAQRLVRTLCQACRDPKPLLPEMLEQMGSADRGIQGEQIAYQPVGCEQCSGSGFLGRTSIYEVLVMTDEIRRLVLRHAEAREIQSAATSEGMRTMFDCGIDKVINGTTTLEEVLRVTRDC